MKNVKDLTPELIKAESKDRFYQIEGTIIRMLAPQDKNYVRPFVYKQKGWGSIERVEATSDGSPQDQRAPKKKRKIRSGEEEIKTSDCWSFKIEKDKILLPWGTNFGLLKNALRRSLQAQRKLRYEEAPLGLIRIYPTWLDVGKTPCESMQNKNMPEIILESRHTQAGDVRVEAFFDFIRDRQFKCLIEIDSEAPINEEKLVALIKSLNTLDTIGPSKRGEIHIDKIVQVEPSTDELEKMHQGEPTQPVVY